MSRLIRFSEVLLIGGSAVKRGPIMAQTCVIQIENRRNLSALSPVLCCRTPNESGPSPPPSSRNGSGQDTASNTKNNTTSNKFNVKRILTLAGAFVVLNLINVIGFNMYWESHFNEK